MCERTPCSPCLSRPASVQSFEADLSDRPRDLEARDDNAEIEIGIQSRAPKEVVMTSKPENGTKSDDLLELYKDFSKRDDAANELITTLADVIKKSLQPEFEEIKSAIRLIDYRNNGPKLMVPQQVMPQQVLSSSRGVSTGASSKPEELNRSEDSQIMPERMRVPDNEVLANDMIEGGDDAAAIIKGGEVILEERDGEFKSETFGHPGVMHRTHSNVCTPQDLEASEGQILLKQNRMHLDMALGSGKMAQNFRPFVEWWFAEPPPTNYSGACGHFAKAVESEHFSKTMAFVIAANVCFMGVSADWVVHHPLEMLRGDFALIEKVFLAVYVVEMLLLIGVHGRFYFTGHHAGHNLLDFTVIFLSLFDYMFTLLQSDGDGINVTFLRLLRCVRVVKIFRAFKVVRFIQDLRVMLECIASSLRSLFWSLIVLSLLMYVFAILFVYAAATFLAEPDEIVSLHDKDLLRMYWGSVGRAMLTLYQSATGGKDWEDMASCLNQDMNLFYLFFLLYVAFICLAVLNILTGIFVDNAMKVTAQGDDGNLKEYMGEQHRLQESFNFAFSLILDGESGATTIPGAEFVESFATNESFKTYLFAMGISSDIDGRWFYEFMTGKPLEADVLTRLAFVNGCMRLRGEAKSTTIHSLGQKVGHLLEELPVAVALLKEDVSFLRREHVRERIPGGQRAEYRV